MDKANKELFLWKQKSALWMIIEQDLGLVNGAETAIAYVEWNFHDTFRSRPLSVWN